MSRRFAPWALVLVVLLAGCAGLPGASPEAFTGEDGDDTATTGATDGVADVDRNDSAGGIDSAGENDSASVDGTMEVHFINVGQADAALIVGPTGETMLMDSGDWRDGGETVVAYLEDRGVDRIDHLVTTHAHADHIGGHAAIIEHYETEKEGVGAVYDPGVPHTSQTYQDYLDAVEAHNVDLFEIREDDLVDFDGVDVTVRNPAEGTDAADLHADSVALHLAHGNTSVLFTGDAEGDAERRMIDEHGDALDADVYQAGHHGSDTSNRGFFLDAVAPTAAVISSNYDSQYGHPDDEVLDRLAERDVDAYWTATHGTIVMTFDGEAISVATQAEAPVDPEALESAEPIDADPTADTEDRRTYALSPPPSSTFDSPSPSSTSDSSGASIASPTAGSTYTPVPTAVDGGSVAIDGDPTAIDGGPDAIPGGVA